MQKKKEKECTVIDLVTDNICEMDVMESYRGLGNEVYRYPDRVKEDLEQYKIESSIVYLPCDIVELRKILSTNSVYSRNCICFFSLGFTKKHLKSYPVFIGVKTDWEFESNNAVIVVEDNNFCFDNRIKRIYVSDKLSNNQIIDINKIVSDERPELSLDIFPIENVSAISKPVLSEFVFNLKKTSQVDTDIRLTDAERQIFDFLVKAKNNIPNAAGVEMRVCGGWVRDKLFGEESDDIDISISSMSGIEFARLLQQYADANGIEGVSKSYAVSLEKSSESSKEDTNPDLMVGGIKVFGQKIEFVPMRTETYTAESRQPIIRRTDSVEEDVVRRDLTINALYYNIETGQVEDYVSGLEDLESMTLRTPLEPEKTFQDDPLRMLRVLRFYSRFLNATISPEVMSALNEPNVQAFYGPPKLAPERAAKEFIKMMSGSKPSDAIRILFESGLYKRVLDVSPELRDIQMDQENPHHAHNVMNHILSVMYNLNEISKQNNLSDQERGWLNLAAFFHDFGKLYPEIQREHPRQPGVKQYIGHEEKSRDFAKDVMTRMGFDKDVKSFVTTVVKHHMWPFMLKHKGMKPEKVDKHIGKFLKKVGDLYDKIIYHSHADILGKGEMSQEEIDELASQKQQEIEMIRRYQEEVGTGITKTLIDGNRIREILQEVVPELVNSNAFINVKGKMVHHLAFIVDKLFEQQWMKNVSTQEDAEMFVRTNAKNWLNHWKQQQSQIQSGNWFKCVKADASSVPVDIGLSEILEEDRDITRVNYTAISPFQIGDIVRLRQVGFGDEQIQGRVIAVGNNSMKINIQTGKYKGIEVTEDLLDAGKLSMKWEKVQ